MSCSTARSSSNAAGRALTFEEAHCFFSRCPQEIPGSHLRAPGGHRSPAWNSSQFELQCLTEKDRLFMEGEDLCIEGEKGDTMFVLIQACEVLERVGKASHFGIWQGHLERVCNSRCHSLGILPKRCVQRPSSALVVTPRERTRR